MQQAKSMAVAIALSAATAFVAAQAQPPAPPGGGRGGGGGGQGRGGGGGGAAAPGAPARGVTVNQNVIQKASAKIEGGKISGTVEFNEYQVANGGLVQVVYNLQGVPPGTHGVHIHTVGRCEGDFASAGGHFDPGPAGNADPDLNHPYHSGDSAEHRRERDGRRHRHELYDAHQSRRPVVADRRRRRGNRHSPESRHESDRHQGSGCGWRHRDRVRRHRQVSFERNYFFGRAQL